jgi:hypothetical protein
LEINANKRFYDGLCDNTFDTSDVKVQKNKNKIKNVRMLPWYCDKAKGTTHFFAKVDSHASIAATHATIHVFATKK